MTADSEHDTSVDSTNSHGRAEGENGLRASERVDSEEDYWLMDTPFGKRMAQAVPEIGASESSECAPCNVEKHEELTSSMKYAELESSTADEDGWFLDSSECPTESGSDTLGIGLTRACSKLDWLLDSSSSSRASRSSTSAS